ncbi:MAG: class I SAM-dependent methyltransferase [Minisyncoccia bacterium]
MERKDLVTLPFADYELLDSGENMKLERYNDIIVARPETQAIWKKKNEELWKEAHAEFSWSENKGSWNILKHMPDSWHVSWENLSFIARLTSFKHTGIFPEQVSNWEWTAAHIATMKEPKVLNLFGYTGIATVAAAKAGAKVTHVDASKQSIAWARENATLSGIPEDGIRWILDDALAFAKREARRSNTYEGIIIDPPAFGRGAKGEVWHIEENLPELMEELRGLLSDTPGSFFLINGYAAGYTPTSFLQLVESTFGETTGEYGELQIKESGSERLISAGIYVRFVR